MAPLWTPIIRNDHGNGMTINEYGTSIYDGKYPKFPLLIKLVSTNQWLSVQVHPDDALHEKPNMNLGEERGLVTFW